MRVNTDSRRNFYDFFKEKTLKKRKIFPHILRPAQCFSQTFQICVHQHLSAANFYSEILFSFKNFQISSKAAE